MMTPTSGEREGAADAELEGMRGRRESASSRS
jgi:hypothetical protein